MGTGELQGPGEDARWELVSVRQGSCAIQQPDPADSSGERRVLARSCRGAGSTRQHNAPESRCGLL